MYPLAARLITWLEDDLAFYRSVIENPGQTHLEHATDTTGTYYRWCRTCATREAPAKVAELESTIMLVQTIGTPNHDGDVDLSPLLTLALPYSDRPGFDQVWLGFIPVKLRVPGRKRVPSVE